jgi:hypothetical protein
MSRFIDITRRDCSVSFDWVYNRTLYVNYIAIVPGQLDQSLIETLDRTEKHSFLCTWEKIIELSLENLLLPNTNPTDMTWLQWWLENCAAEIRSTTNVATDNPARVKTNKRSDFLIQLNSAETETKLVCKLRYSTNIGDFRMFPIDVRFFQPLCAFYLSTLLEVYEQSLQGKYNSVNFLSVIKSHKPKRTM